MSAEDLGRLAPGDHRRIGAELELFTIDPDVGTGLPLWLPKGEILRHTLETYVRSEEEADGYQFVATPHLGREELYKRSGHLQHYRKLMFPPMTVEGERYVLKPMNCPHHIRIYQARPRSYRDLPMRIAEFGTMYRYEKSGELMGLTRVRGMTLNDAHIFCAEEHIESEVRSVLKLTQKIYQTLGLTNYRIAFALHDPKNKKKKYVDNPALWAKSEAALRTAATNADVPFFEAAGEAAFYGPKLDLQMTDAAGHEFTVSTIQLDMLLPERFHLSFTDTQGEKGTPVLIHRAPIGTLERFIAFLIEHFAGAFPLWLAPIQVRVLPVSDTVRTYAERVTKAFRDAGLRVEPDTSPATLPKKIRDGETEKIPVLAIVGEKEAAGETVSLRLHGGKDLGPKPLPDTIRFLQEKVQSRALTLD